ncbi:MAG: hypothetical protein HXS47_11590 [Theionarchaea archaeon]|nr:hypothetical protein [Theionarchaea archaeon]
MTCRKTADDAACTCSCSFCVDLNESFDGPIIGFLYLIGKIASRQFSPHTMGSHTLTAYPSVRT